MRANQMAKNSPASPRVVRRGTARPAENRFIRLPKKQNAEILSQSAVPDNPKSRPAWARRAMYPRRPRRVVSERGRVAACCDRLNNSPLPT